MSTSASARVGQNADILRVIFSHLNESALFSCLLTCSAFFELVTPMLYRSLRVSHARDGFVGATRQSSHLFMPSCPTSPSSARFSKNALLSLIREVHVGTHGKNECPFVLHYINPLPHLQYVHLSGGPWPTELEPEEICAFDSCQFLAKVCTQATRVLLRETDTRVVKSLIHLEHITLKIRPCQLPMYLFQDSTYAWPFELPMHRAKSLDLVFWDERHNFRVDWRTTVGGGFSPPMMRLTFRPHGDYSGHVERLRGCVYCDQKGCIRHLPQASMQLPALMRAIGAKTEIENVRIWNVDKTAERQWNFMDNAPLSVEAVKRSMTDAFVEAREEKWKNHANRKDLSVSFHSAAEYYSSVRHKDEIDEDEAKYWEMITAPSQRILQLGQEVTEILGGECEHYVGYPEAELEEIIENTKRWNEGFQEQ
ncbi:uncharacterized protein L203_104185 [Cryptococcus depauperatus CBS 7841]|uniref:Uncharacterized protein n=1 Tax=Cryptococcus depauperatus CBS 7841 TaxID=1295531 RepID=A0A1E3HH94_9TREE|nr:hypothetical protein L203_06492 [Cryptococcus depauperatus CBS 7841]